MKLYFENIKLGGGMELPYDNNYCIFIKNNITTIKKVNSKKDFKDCEYTYGTFIDVSDSIEDAKIKVSQFSGPAKDNKLNILNEEDDLSKSKKRMNESTSTSRWYLLNELKEWYHDRYSQYGFCAVSYDEDLNLYVVISDKKGSFSLDEKQVLRKLGYDKNTIIHESKNRMNENIFCDVDSSIDSDPQHELYNDMVEFAHYIQLEFGYTKQESIQILRDTFDDAIKAI